MRRANCGFTLFEMLVVLLGIGLVVGLVMTGLVAVVRGLVPPQIVLNGETLSVAPAYAPFSPAVDLHQTLADRIGSARAVYVLGGRHLSLAVDARAAQQMPLAATTLPTITDFTSGLPLDAKSFYEQYAAQLGPMNPGAHAEDFSVVVVGPHNGALAVTCFVQVVRTTQTLTDGYETDNYVVREVQLADVGGSTARYVFAERPERIKGLFVGAVHSWYRYSEAAGQYEEGPASLVFPDPWLYAGARGNADDVPPFSRFVYFIPVSS